MAGRWLPGGAGKEADALMGELQRLQSIAVDRGLLLDVAMLNKALASA